MPVLKRKSANGPARLLVGLLWLGFGALAGWSIAEAAFAAKPGLSMVTGMLTLFVAATVAAFSLRYMRADLRAHRYFLLLGALVVSVLGFLFAGNLLVFAAAWWASGWLLAGMIGHATAWSEAEFAARRARWTFALGDLALFGALGLLGWHAGSWQIDAVLATAAELTPIAAGIAGLLMVVAAAARCALPPFSSWLLLSLTAPTPVSALMHAGLVNAGGFLLIRFAPVFEAAPAARMAAIFLGICAAIYGIGIMLVRPDVKRGLAGSTISQMGFMILSCGLGAYAAALWHIVAHGLFKAWLFLGSGSTIGMKAGKPATNLSGRAALTIAAGTVGVALSLLAFDEAEAGSIPLLLGLATAFATLLAGLGGRLQARARIVLVLTVALVLALHGLGLALTRIAVGADAAPIVPEWCLLLVLLVFLGTWVWQQHRASTGRGLPLPLYVHLINAGAVPIDDKGDDK